MSEEKYYYNGVYIDLNGLPIEEYMKPPFFICKGGGGSEEPTKTRNNITVYSELNNEDSKIYYKAKAEYPVTSFIELTVISTTNTKTVLELHVGETETQKEEGDTLDILAVNINVNKDDEYEYKIMIDNIGEYFIYTKAIPATDVITNPKDSGFDEIMMDLNSTADIEFIIPKTDININEFEPEEKLYEYYINNQYRLVIFIPKKIFALNKYIILNSINEDVKNKFKNIEENSIIINNIEYIYIYEGATDEETMSMYVPSYNGETNYKYKLSLIK